MKAQSPGVDLLNDMSNRFNSDVSDVNKALKKNIMSLKRTCGPNAAVYVQAEKHFVDVSSKLQAAAQEVKLIREKLSARFKLLNKAAPKTPSAAEDGDSVDSSTLTTISTVKKKKPVQIAVVTKNTFPPTDETAIDHGGGHDPTRDLWPS